MTVSFWRRRIWQERLHTARFFYQKPLFALLDLLFGLVGLFINPYRISRKFLARQNAGNLYAYGETPYTTYRKIAAECGIGPDDVWVEMGAGRGKGCFWLAFFVGCWVIGIEQIPLFIRLARFFKILFRMSKIKFLNQNALAADLSSATFVYLYGIWPDRPLPKNVKCLSVGEPLPQAKVIKSFWVRYPWGRTRAFLQFF